MIIDLTRSSLFSSTPIASDESGDYVKISDEEIQRVEDALLKIPYVHTMKKNAKRGNR